MVVEGKVGGGESIFTQFTVMTSVQKITIFKALKVSVYCLTGHNNSTLYLHQPVCQCQYIWST